MYALHAVNDVSVSPSIYKINVSQEGSARVFLFEQKKHPRPLVSFFVSAQHEVQRNQVRTYINLLRLCVGNSSVDKIYIIYYISYRHSNFQHITSNFIY